MTIDTQSTGIRVDEIIDKGRFTLSQVGIVAICVMLNFVDGFDVTTIAVSKKAIAADLALSASSLGVLDAVGLGGMCLGAMFLGALSDIIGRRRMILTSATVITLCMFLTALVQNFEQFFMIRLLTGLAVGAMLASIATIASEFSPEKYKSLAVTLSTAGYPLGAVLGGAVGPTLIEAWGWQGVFFFGAAATGLMAFIALIWLPESLHFLSTRQPDNALDRFNKILSRIGRSQISELPPAHVQSRRGVLSTMLGIFENLDRLFRGGLARKTLTFWGAFFLCYITLFFLMSWIPFLIEDAGYSRQQGGSAFALFNVGGVIGICILGLMTTRLPLGPMVSLFLALSAVMMMVFANLDVGIGTMMIVIMLIGFLMQGGFTGFYAGVVKTYPSEIKATGLGWAIGLGRVGAVLGPYMAGRLIDSGVSMQANFIIFACPLLLGAFLAFTLKMK